MTQSTRRQFVGTTAALSGLAVTPRPVRALLAPGGTPTDPIVSIRDPRVETFVKRALEVASSAGATYADVRLTYTKHRFFDELRGGQDLPAESEFLGVGVRALVNGYWGFASSPVWSQPEMERLAREAARQAKVNSLSKPRDFTFPSAGPAVRGHWETPVKIDAFTVHPLEVRDHLRASKRILK